ncbi:hypothetical protein [Actinomadura montaniterrae]|uniref:Uncharacterized protein n=1 Tax=Actinomadura montaniterrae TaxID=1803903 RepID=A0A6L3VIG7_9ACTN|nr:hypothetical protein [Actinomadura montaniterrae]KAB2370530.1 hypothetical protein F9B16_35370 [Actinomadura montaniterrae]
MRDGERPGDGACASPSGSVDVPAIPDAAPAAVAGKIIGSVRPSRSGCPVRPLGGTRRTGHSRAHFRISFGSQGG